MLEHGRPHGRALIKESRCAGVVLRGGDTHNTRTHNTHQTPSQISPPTERLGFLSPIEARNGLREPCAGVGTNAKQGCGSARECARGAPHLGLCVSTARSDVSVAGGEEEDWIFAKYSRVPLASRANVV